MATPGALTIHVLDTARGRPAAGVEVALHRLSDDRREHVRTRTTNAEGRTDEPLLEAGELSAGTYELTFSVGGPFFGEIPVRFTVTDPAEGLHVPLLLSPFAYSVYRGS